MVYELLLEHFKALGKYPARIVFLRDGVSEGQFKQVEGSIYIFLNFKNKIY